MILSFFTDYFFYLQPSTLWTTITLPRSALIKHSMDNSGRLKDVSVAIVIIISKN